MDSVFFLQLRPWVYAPYLIRGAVCFFDILFILLILSELLLKFHKRYPVRASFDYRPRAFDITKRLVVNNQTSVRLTCSTGLWPRIPKENPTRQEPRHEYSD